jgi:hypothetical protein
MRGHGGNVGFRRFGLIWVVAENCPLLREPFV